MDPEVPINSIVVVPVGARLEALQMRVAVTLPLAGGVTGFAEAVAETPLGNSFTLIVTGELKPLTLVTFKVVDVLPLSSIVKDDGVSVIVKFLVPEVVTVSAIVVL